MTKSKNLSKSLGLERKSNLELLIDYMEMDSILQGYKDLLKRSNLGTSNSKDLQVDQKINMRIGDHRNQNEKEIIRIYYQGNKM